MVTMIASADGDAETTPDVMILPLLWVIAAI